MKETIYRDEAIKALHDEWDECLVVDESGEYIADICENVIDTIPSADRPSAVDLSSVYSTAYKSGYEKGKADRPQGEWIYGEHDVAMCDGYRCDRCGFFVPWDYEHKSIDFINDYNFCPNCGCRMKGADDEVTTV